MLERDSRLPKANESRFFLFIYITKMKDLSRCTIKAFLFPVVVQGFCPPGLDSKASTPLAVRRSTDKCYRKVTRKTAFTFRF